MQIGRARESWQIHKAFNGKFASSRVHVQSAWTAPKQESFLIFTFCLNNLKVITFSTIFKRNINKNISLPSELMCKWRCFHWSNDVTLTNQRSFIEYTMTSFSRNRDDRVFKNERHFFLQKIINECNFNSCVHDESQFVDSVQYRYILSTTSVIDARCLEDRWTHTVAAVLWPYDNVTNI